MTVTTVPVRAKRELWSGHIGFILANIAAAVGLGSIWKFSLRGRNQRRQRLRAVLPRGVRADRPAAHARRARPRPTRPVRRHSKHPKRCVGGRGLAAMGLRRRDRGGRRLSDSELLLGHRRVGDRLSGRHRQDRLAGRRRTSRTGTLRRLRASPLKLALYHLVFMAITAAIVARGIAGGIEEASKILMPMLVTLIATLAIYSAIEGDFARTLRFLFVLDTTQLKPQVLSFNLWAGWFPLATIPLFAHEVSLILIRSRGISPLAQRRHFLPAALGRSIRGPPRLRYGDRAATPFRRISPTSSEPSRRCSSSRQQQPSHRRVPSSSPGSKGRAKLPIRPRPPVSCQCRLTKAKGERQWRRQSRLSGVNWYSPARVNVTPSASGAQAPFSSQAR